MKKSYLSPRMLITVCLSIMSLLSGSAIRFEYPIKISTNQRYFTDARGLPFFYQACTGWELFSMLTREETEVYLKNRSEKG
ncbi:MAG TPA: DUF4038 domain-containing protein, partial [Bacteroidales bacterium]|nr:DUF4038 domain-containing protein [Bacteroidales bacterium]